MGNPAEETCCHPNLKTDCGWVARRFARRPCSLPPVLRRTLRLSTSQSAPVVSPKGAAALSPRLPSPRGYLGYAWNPCSTRNGLRPSATTGRNPFRIHHSSDA